MCHLDTAQCRILKDSGRFLEKIPRGLGLIKPFIFTIRVAEFEPNLEEKLTATSFEPTQCCKMILIQQEPQSFHVMFQSSYGLAKQKGSKCDLLQCTIVIIYHPSSQPTGQLTSQLSNQQPTLQPTLLIGVFTSQKHT